ncbi:MAG: HAMP domain-containing protein [Candidatus Paracaedibacteraceae bacterium]|nr:HAMP domain-containing protein [Candidatus Paracaedibacteraceae bacterium]
MQFKIFNSRNFQRLELWLHKASFSRKLFYVLVLLAVLSGFSTYISFIKESSSDSILNLIILNLIILFLLILTIASQLIKIFVRRRHGDAGARFHSRLVMVFSFLSIAPTLVIYFMSSTLFERGVQALVGHFTHDTVQKTLLFSNNIRDSLKENMEILAQQITLEIKQANADNLEAIPDSETLLENIHQKYNLKELFILNNTKTLIFPKSIIGDVPSYLLEETIWDNLEKGFFSVYFASDGNSIIAGYPLDLDKGLFLFITQPINPFIPKHFKEVNTIVKKYQEIEQNRWQIRFMFMAIYGLFVLLSLLIAIGIGILLADHISKPISQLVDAAQKIRQGHLDTRVRMEPNIIEFLGLAKAFNLMVNELQKQKDKLETANADIEKRRNFIETTLKGLTSGVVGLDDTNHIQVINDSAATILGLSSQNSLDKLHILDILPELNDLLYEHSKMPLNDELLSKRSQKLIVTERDGNLFYLSIHIANTTASSDIRKVLTIDDITELHLAQKKAAWGDVARRVAHEIKNPLTPIQLSAERLKRKLNNLLPDTEKETFNINIETIIRQVGEIERIVKEFSQLSRMPQPLLHEHDIVYILRQCVILQKNAYEGITFKENYPKEAVIILCDDQLIGQAITNILKNSIESLLEILPKNKQSPKISILLTVEDKNVTIKILDNGRGFPTNMIDKFIEPYVTTKQKGTGLGLAITKKIIDDHNGILELKNQDHQGAEVIVKLPLHQ